MGGAEQVLKMIAIYYADRGYQIDVCFLTQKKGNLWEDLPSNISLHYTTQDDEFKGFIKLCRNIRKLNREFSYCFTSHIYLNSFLGLLRKMNLVRIEKLIGRDSRSYFVTGNRIKKFFYRSLILLGYSNLDLLVCQTNHMRDKLIEELPQLVRKTKIEVIPNPVNLAQMKVKCNTSPSFTDYIVSAGRLIPEKGFDILIDSFGILRKKHPELNLIILGEGPLRTQLQKQIDTSKLSECILLQGFVTDVYSYFKLAKACVVSSRNEGFPNVLLQMMSQNTKVVSTLCAGGIEDIQGLYVSNIDSSVELAQKIQVCLDDDTSINKVYFDEELTNRSIHSFIHSINKFLNEEI